MSEVVVKARGRNLFFLTQVDEAVDEAEKIFISVSAQVKTYGAGMNVQI